MMVSPKKCLRKAICDAVASSNCTKSSDISSELDNIFDNIEDFSCDWSQDDSDNITPLMLACDKCCSDALIYLQTQLNSCQYNISQPMKNFIDAWGHPNDESSHGNRAAHHALAAGFSDGIDLLERIWCCLDANDEGRRLCRYLSLLSQTNHNRDTPLMMACVSDHGELIRSILERSVQIAVNTHPDDINASVNDTWQTLSDILNIRNAEECTALNLACGHGHYNIVKILMEPHNLLVTSNTDSILEVSLLDGESKNNSMDESNDTNCKVFTMEPLVDVSFTDYDSCKRTLEQLDAKLKPKTQELSPAMMNEFSIQQKKINDCLAAMESELSRIATRTANELLLLDNKQSGSTVKLTSFTTEASKTYGSLKTKKKKKQRRANRQIQTDKAFEDRVFDAGVLNGISKAGLLDGVNKETHKLGWDIVTNKPEDNVEESSPSPFVTTLQDGTVISRNAEITSHVDTHDDDSSSIDDIDKLNTNKEVKSLERILQSTKTSNRDSDMTALMESLCLDPSMLLLSPHGMAIMSPCQLDAIESILTHQLNATKEAQRIQRKLLNK
jgi:ankyrin repeat protein